jgi:hypothetical protein
MRPIFPIVVASLLTVSAGCGSPNTANVDLRKERQALQEQVASLESEVEQLRLQLRVIEGERGTIETLPQDRLSLLFTVGGLDVNRLTQRTDGGLEVYVQPLEGSGDLLKAAGAMTVEAFDLSATEQVRIAMWEFPLEDARDLWQKGGLFSGYRLVCDWPADVTPPAAGQPILLKIAFTDGLTGRTMSANYELE